MSAVLDTDEQRMPMEAIVARFPRKVYASLAECGGDASVLVEKIADHGAIRWKATRKDSRDGMVGWGGMVDEAIVDLSRSESIYADVKLGRGE